MFIRKRRPFDPVGGKETPRELAVGRRKWLAATGIGAAALATAGYAGWRRLRGGDDEVIIPGSGSARLARFFPAPQDGRFQLDRPQTDEPVAARHTNFYEFSALKWCWRYVERFQTDPWTIHVDGLCRQPLKLDIGDFLSRYSADLTERLYRHRCVETWAMAVPWTGVPLARVLQDVDPLATATHVRFISFNRPREAGNIASHPSFPWPYVEGLTVAEAKNDLVLLATGMYGHPLLKQHGAPVRLVVPWKYGYKSIKSIVNIQLLDHEPATFWTTLNPRAYPFESNVDPEVPRPWPQHTESMLGSGDRYPTQRYNGYEAYVAGLYSVLR
ncbi:MAG TPA: protein-methionine-sulfoxide reductase catalytic subunit MsrP [Pirellulales bacterium]|nr:protein-methionine-sulfoxide reductase catalytic subunit MsrP [Pirellulales bacterium]